MQMITILNNFVNSVVSLGSSFAPGIVAHMKMDTLPRLQTSDTWAFLRGAAHAAVHLLRLAATLAFAIPGTTLLAWLLPASGLWAHTSPAALGVDATAFVGGLGFVWLARATARRIEHGPKDSVWSARVF